MKKGIAITAAVLIVCAASLLILPSNNRRTAKRDIQAIEKFRTAHSRLPATMSEAGISDADQQSVYYQIQGANHYIVWYGTTLGVSDVYDSETHTWSEQG